MPNSVSRSGGVGGELTAIAVPKASARLPDWVAMRPFSNSAHLIATLANRDKVRLSFPALPRCCAMTGLQVPRGVTSRKQGLNTYPVPMQEQIIADDLLYVLIGIPGKFPLATDSRTMSSDRSARPPPR